MPRCGPPGASDGPRGTSGCRNQCPWGRRRPLRRCWRVSGGTGADRVVRPYEWFIVAVYHSSGGGGCCCQHRAEQSPAPTNGFFRLTFVRRGWASPPHPSASPTPSPPRGRLGRRAIRESPLRRSWRVSGGAGADRVVRPYELVGIALPHYANHPRSGSLYPSVLRPQYSLKHRKTAPVGERFCFAFSIISALCLKSPGGGGYGGAGRWLPGCLALRSGHRR